MKVNVNVSVDVNVNVMVKIGINKYKNEPLGLGNVIWRGGVWLAYDTASILQAAIQDNILTYEPANRTFKFPRYQNRNITYITLQSTYSSSHHAARRPWSHELW